MRVSGDVVKIERMELLEVLEVRVELIKILGDRQDSSRTVIDNVFFNPQNFT